MSEPSAPPGVIRPGRRCRRRHVDPSSPRPSELLRAFFVAALLFIGASAAAAVAYAISGDDRLHWLALHLLFLGGVSQLVLGAGQFFTCAFLATDPPPKRLVRAQLGAWSLGTVLVAAGVPTGLPALVEVGAAAIAAGLVLFALALHGMQRRSLQRAPWALRWYQASAACLALGGFVGVLMARDTAWPHGSLLGTHLALNVAGWLGTAMIGTLHTFFPSLTQTQLRYPRLQRPTYVLWLLGVSELAIGAAFTSRPILATGWTDLLVAGALLSANLLASLRAAQRPLALPPRLLALAHAFLLAGLAVAVIATLRVGADGPFTGTTRAALATLLLVGWTGLTVTGSLLHLLAILGRIRNFKLTMPRPRPAREWLLTAAAAIAVAGLALSHAGGMRSLSVPAAILTLAIAAVLGGRVIALAVRALAPTRAAAS